MFNARRTCERGFTMLECGIAVAIISIIVAIALPRLNNAMREHKVNIGMRLVVDTIKRAKMQAVSENKDSGLAVDTTGRRIGVVIFNDDLSLDRIEFIPLPDGVSFQRPDGVTAVPDGVKTTTEVVSFAKQGSYNQQKLNSRGFPTVGSGADVISIFLGNGKSYRAITMSSVGGIRTYTLENNAWLNTGQLR